MKAIVIYHTKHGSTKLYAEWIKQAAGNIDIARLEQADSLINNYDVIVIASRTYMGRIAASSFLRKKWDILKNKKLYLVVVGMAPQEDEASQKSFNMIPEEIRDHLGGYLKAPGKIGFEGLKFYEKLILKKFKTKEEDKTDKKYIEPVVKWLQDNLAK